MYYLKKNICTKEISKLINFALHNLKNEKLINNVIIKNSKYFIDKTCIKDNQIFTKNYNINNEKNNKNYINNISNFYNNLNNSFVVKLNEIVKNTNFSNIEIFEKDFSILCCNYISDCLSCSNISDLVHILNKNSKSLDKKYSLDMAKSILYSKKIVEFYKHIYIDSFSLNTKLGNIKTRNLLNANIGFYNNYNNTIFLNCNYLKNNLELNSDDKSTNNNVNLKQ